MMRIGQERLRGAASIAGLANDTTDSPPALPAPRKGRKAQRSDSRQPLSGAQVGARGVA